MRFGGAYPFSKPAFPVHLFSGHIYTLPPGNFVVDLGRVSVLQTFDNESYTWRCVGLPGAKHLVTNSDGYNFRIVNMSGVVTGAAIANGGSGGTNGIGPSETGCSISFGSAPTGGRAAKGYVIVGGAINTTVSIVDGGSGYLVPPLLLFDPPPRGGIRAAGYATISGGAINSVVVTNPGAGYRKAPGIKIIPQFASYAGADLADPSGNTVVSAPRTYPPTTEQGAGDAMGNNTGAGSGAKLAVNATLAGSGQITGVVVYDYGSNYTSPPTISISGGPSGASLTPIMSFSVTGVTLSNAGAGLSAAPTWQSSFGLVQSSDGANNFYKMRPAGGVGVLSSTTPTILASVALEDPGFGLQKAPTIGFSHVGATTAPAATAAVGGIADTSIVQPGVS